ncbi:MAG TPA: TonB-dependent receptor [Sphingobium sp.]|uniref:TonB-dependent receptor n=1 Tax=Sphingobium sp. TaxID=1912891 RepID=UPI002ED6034C
MIRYITGISYGALTIAIVATAPVHAQSTGTQVFERSDIVVTGRKEKEDVAGVSIPDTPKERRTFNQEMLSHAMPGQTVDDIINYMPGVSFQNNGPYGDAGGTLTIHGFDGSRIAQTFDGIPMNDSGNYALYSQEQIDHELIDRVDVSLGSTDIDSPTASATGSTVNYVTRNPTEDFHARMSGSMGQWDYMRVFGVIDTGVFTPFGTRAFVSASAQSDNYPYDERAKLNKHQFNAKIYQPIGSSGDFVSVAGWWSESRGNRFGDFFLKNGSGNFPTADNLGAAVTPSCTTTPATSGKDTANSCGTAYDLGYNPSNRGNIRANSRFTLADGLVLTIDPSYSYTKSNGSGAVAATEGSYSLKNGTKTTPIYGYIGGKPYFGGVPLNGDGDILDTVEVNAPSNTVTNRFTVVANLIYNLTANHRVRLNYTYDRAQLRQTGEVGLLQQNGEPADYFTNDHGLTDISGQPIQKRNRLSYSTLNQVAGEYRGEFLDRKLILTAGIRAPFFKRELANYCVSEASGNGYVDCFNDSVSQAAFLAANPSYQAPQSRRYNFSRALPSAGFTYKITPETSVFLSYSQGIYVPSTDILYDSFAFPLSDPNASPIPETTFNFEGGLRYRSHKIQAEVSGWYTVYHNRIASSSIPDPRDETTTVTVFTNLGTVHKYGVDASISYAPIKQLSFYLFGSYLHSEILSNVANGECTANNVKFGDSAGVGTCTSVGQTIYALTAGKREAGSPTLMVGGRAQGNLGPVSLGVQAKYTGSRYVNDVNVPFVTSATSNVVVFPAKAPDYTLVDLDARVKLGFLGLNDKTYLQLNVHNLFDKFYVGGFAGGTISTYRVPYAYLGTPRTISGTINIAF